MKKDNSMTEAMMLLVAEVNDMLGGITLEDIKVLRKGRIRFSVYPEAKYMDVDISALEITTRPINGLHRVGYMKIKDLLGNPNISNDLKNIRGMGNKSCEEIMLGIFLYQFRSLKKEQQEIWLQEVLELNGITTAKKL